MSAHGTVALLSENNTSNMGGEMSESAHPRTQAR